jgi:hypothetical protein
MRTCDVVALGFALGLVALSVSILAVPYLPVQDFPQQLRMLMQHRHLVPGQLTEYLRVQSSLVFGYSLYRTIDSLWAVFLSPDTSLRLIFLLSIVWLEIAVARLSRRAGGGMPLACLLALPLCVSNLFWFGLAPVMLGLAACVSALSPAIDFCRQPRTARALELAIWLLLALLAHPLALALTCLLICLIALRHRARWRVWAGLLASALPGTVLLAWDLARNGYGTVPGVPSVGPAMTKPDVMATIIDLLVQPIGAQTDAWFPLRVPFYIAMGACAWRARSAAAATPGRRALVWGALVLVVLTFVIPRNSGAMMGVPCRLATLAVVLLATVSGAALPTLSARWRAAVAAAVLLDIGASAAQLARDGERIRAIVGDVPPRSISGTILSVRFNDCAHLFPSFAWRSFDPFHDVWAYGLSDTAATAQMFAFGNYHYVQFRRDRYQELPGVTWDKQLLDGFTDPDKDGCQASNRRRFRVGLDRGVKTLLVGLPPELEAELGGQSRAFRHLGPGMIEIAAVETHALAK